MRSSFGRVQSAERSFEERLGLSIELVPSRSRALAVKEQDHERACVLDAQIACRAPSGNSKSSGGAPVLLRWRWRPLPSLRHPVVGARWLPPMEGALSPWLVAAVLITTAG